MKGIPGPRGSSTGDLIRFKRPAGQHTNWRPKIRRESVKFGIIIGKLIDMLNHMVIDTDCFPAGFISESMPAVVTERKKQKWLNNLVLTIGTAIRAGRFERRIATLA